MENQEEEKGPKGEIAKNNEEFKSQLEEFGADKNELEYKKIMTDGKIRHVEVENLAEGHDKCTVFYKTGPNDRIIIERNASGKDVTYKYEKVALLDAHREATEERLRDAGSGFETGEIEDLRRSHLAGGDDLPVEKEI